ncbi:MAG: hypothetical protein M3275_12630 [Thermoproteota archaeon]|nr:hypothetical protein [Thermoproteota archaeon]
MSKNGSGHITRDDATPYQLTKIISQQQFQIKYMKGHCRIDVIDGKEARQMVVEELKSRNCPDIFSSCFVGERPANGLSKNMPRTRTNLWLIMLPYAGAIRSLISIHILQNVQNSRPDGNVDSSPV